MLDPSVSLIVWNHPPGGGQGQHLHLAPIRGYTLDGQKVVNFARSRPDRENAAIINAYTKQGLQWIDTGMDASRYGSSGMAGGGPPRYDAHTGRYHDYGAEYDVDPVTGQVTGVVICTDESILLAKNEGHPPGAHHGGQALSKR